MLLYSNKYGDGACKELKALVLENMIRDEVYDCLVKDRLILTYGSCLLETVAVFKKINNISQRMRATSRLLIEMRKGCGQDDLILSDCLSPEKFDAVVEATKVLGGYSMENKEEEMLPTFKTPSLPLIIGYSLEKCAALQNGLVIKEKNPSCIANAKDFLKLYKLEWSGKISTISLNNLDINKFNKVQLLPVTEDLMEVRRYMKQNIVILTEELKKKPTLDTWRLLAELTASRLTIFNRRRGNEVMNLLYYLDIKKETNSRLLRLMKYASL